MNIGIDRGNGDYSAVTFAKMGDDGIAVILASLTGEPADAFINLLRVAKASKEYTRVHEVVDGTTIGTVFDMRFATRELEEALEEVKDLL